MHKFEINLQSAFNKSEVDKTSSDWIEIDEHNKHTVIVIVSDMKLLGEQKQNRKNILKVYKKNRLLILSFCLIYSVRFSPKLVFPVKISSFFIIFPNFYIILRDHFCNIPQTPCVTIYWSALVVIHNAKQFVHNGIAFCGNISHQIVQK